MAAPLTPHEKRPAPTRETVPEVQTTTDDSRSTAAQTLHAPRIAICGHYHGGNLGDEIVVSTLIAQLRGRLADGEMVGLSLNPSDTRYRHGIEAFPMARSAVVAARQGPHVPGFKAPSASNEGNGSQQRLKRWVRNAPGANTVLRAVRSLWRNVKSVCCEPFFCLRSLRRLRGINLLIVAGSGQLYDGWSGPWNHPYNLFRWALLAKISKTPFALVSVGAGPFSSRLGRFFIRKTVEWSSYSSFRDEFSAQLIRGFAAETRQFSVYPDLAFSYPLASLERASNRRSTSRTMDPSPNESRLEAVVGLNAYPYFDRRYSKEFEDALYDAYMSAITQFACWLVKERYRINLFYTQTRADYDVNQRLRAALLEAVPLEHQTQVFVPNIETHSDLINEISSCRFVVAGRFHGTLLPHLLGIPAIGLAYNEKTHELYRYLGYPQFAVDGEGLTAKELIEKFEELRDVEDEFKDTLPARTAALRARLDEQYDRLIAGFCGSQSK